MIGQDESMTCVVTTVCKDYSKRCGGDNTEGKILTAVVKRYAIWRTLDIYSETRDALSTNHVSNFNTGV